MSLTAEKKRTGFATESERYYATRYQPDPRRSAVWRPLCRWLQQFVPVNATVLELGAGYCDFINNICALHKIALDLSETVRIAAATGVETHVGSCTKLSFVGDASVDMVFASNLLEHLEMPAVRETLGEIKRVLKPGGKALVIQPNFRYCYREYFDDYTHVSVFTDKSLPQLLVGAGFIIERVTPRFMPYSLQSSLPVHSLLVSVYLRSPVKPLAGQMLVIARKA